MIKTIHPFPARMGPDLAIDRLKQLKKPSVVLDPMVGSGTVVRHASDMGHRAIGRDLDPLAILITRVWTTPVDDREIGKQFERLIECSNEIGRDARLPWIDDDEDTSSFVKFWFGLKQRNALRTLAFGLMTIEASRNAERHRAAIDVLRLALSRIIITKDSGASLGRDISHSRPHKVADKSDYDVIGGFERSLRQVRDRLLAQPPCGNVLLERGDARYLKDLENESVDVVLSSPPYLNAIDYMRGHRLSLVWLGYGLDELRRIRTMSVGSERGPDKASTSSEFNPILDAMGDIHKLPNAEQKMIGRYAEDMYRLMAELTRVLTRDGRINLVIGDSCLRKVFIRNSEGFAAAGRMNGLKVTRKVERVLPTGSRYLPLPKSKKAALGKRMRSETVLTLMHV